MSDLTLAWLIGFIGTFAGLVAGWTIGDARGFRRGMDATILEMRKMREERQERNEFLDALKGCRP